MERFFTRFMGYPWRGKNVAGKKIPEIIGA
jgi:hypothetical protein